MPRSWRALIESPISSTVSSSSGITIASAPPAMPLKTAIQPVLRPITSITITRSCDCGGRVQAVDRVGRDLHRGVEAEREVGAGDVVVDRLRHADHRQPVLVQPAGDAHRVLAADRDDRVEAVLPHGRLHPLDAVLVAVGVVARGGEDRAAERQDPGDGAHVERHVAALGEPRVAAPQADHLVPGGKRPAGSRPGSPRSGQGSRRPPSGRRSSLRRNIGRRRSARDAAPVRIARRSPPGLPRPFLTALLVLACVAAVAGCGDEQSRSGRVPGDTLTIFSSLPLQGPHADQAQSIVNAQKLALREAGGKAGDFKVNFASRRRRDRRRRPRRVGPGQDRRERPQGGREHAHDRLHRRLRLRRDRDLAADHERGRLRAGEPGFDRGRASRSSPRARRRASRTSSTRRATAPSRASCRPTTSRPRRPRAGRGGSARAACSCSATSRWRATGSPSCTATAAKDAGLRVVGQERMDPRDEDYRDFAREVARTQSRRRVLRRRRGEQRGAALAGPPERAAARRSRSGSHNLLGARVLRPPGIGRVRAPTSPRSRRTRASCRPAGSASCATTAASSASRPTASRPTATRR